MKWACCSLADKGLQFCEAGCSLTVVPNVGRKLPVISDFFPNHKIFTGHVLWVCAFRPQAKGPYLLCCGGTQRLDVESHQLRITDFFSKPLPHCRNGGSAAHHR